MEPAVQGYQSLSCRLTVAISFVFVRTLHALLDGMALYPRSRVNTNRVQTPMWPWIDEECEAVRDCRVSHEKELLAPHTRC